MKKLFSLFFVTLLVVSVAFSGVSLAGDGSDYRQLQVTKVFLNNSGATLNCGDVVVLDRSGTGVSSGTTLGAYVTTTTQPDNSDVVGVVQDNNQSYADQAPVPVVVYGPCLTKIRDAGDAVTTGWPVATTNVAGFAGGAITTNNAAGRILGQALEAGDGTNSDRIIIFVDPK